MKSLTKPSAKILLVEDDAMNQFIAKKFLVKWGYDVAVANNGIEAVEMVQSKKYNLVLMDMHMPGMDGTEAARIIRLLDDVYFKELPIIAFSAVVENREHALSIGMNDFTTKPINPGDLQEKIKKYLVREAAKAERRPHIDFDIYTDGDENFKHELARLMITNLHDLQRSIGRSVDGNNIEILQLVLHKVKPTLAMLNDPEMNTIAELAKTIELTDPAFGTISRELHDLADEMITVIENQLKPEPMAVEARAKAA